MNKHKQINQIIIIQIYKINNEMYIKKQVNKQVKMQN